MLNSHVMLNRNTQGGVGLVEVLVAVVVLAIGILALTNFQGSALRSGSDAKNRTIATSIAQGEIEQIRAFTDVAGYTAITSSGGPKTVTVQGANTNFSVTSTVTNHFFSGSTQAATTTAPTSTTNPDFKLVRVVVNWDDEVGVNQQVALQSYINSNLPTASGLTLTAGSTHSSPTTTLTSNIPGALPIDLTEGEGGIAEGTQISTTPAPKVTTASGTVEVSVETIQKNPTSNKVLGRDQFRTINCVCRMGRSDGQKGLAPAVFAVGNDGFSDDRWIPGKEIIGKPVGRMADDNGQTNVGGVNLQLSKQPEICDICCRDHHDGGTGNLLKYDPFRPSSDYVSGNHKHYFPDSDGVLEPTAGSDPLYLENCRFTRIDGLWRVVQDWRLESLQVLAQQDLDSTSGQGYYTDHVKEFIKQYILNIHSSYPTLTPSPTVFGSTYTDTLSNLGDKSVEINLQSTDITRQLATRAIYIDYMDSEWINRIKCKISGCGDIAADTEWLEEVPFYEINVTKLADWISDDLAIASVTSASISNADYSRGLVTASGINVGTTSIEAAIKRSNSGLTNTRAIDLDDQNALSDAFDVTVTGGSNQEGYRITGTYNISNNVGISDSTPELITTSTLGAACQTKPTVKVQGKPTWECVLKQDDTSISITFGNYNYAACGSGNDRRNFGNFDSQVTVSSSNISPAPVGSVLNSGTPSETTSFTLSELTGNATLDVNISFVSFTVTEINSPNCL